MFTTAVAQSSRTTTYDFLRLPSGARSAALGGTPIAIYEPDAALAYDNPAHLSSRLHNVLSFNYANWFRDVNIASADYVRCISQHNVMGYGIRYVDYGRFDGRTETDAPTDRFTAKDMVAHVSYGRWLSPHWSAGATMKIIYSVCEKYQSVGMAFDVGFSYHNTERGVTVGLVMRDAGFQFKGYHSVEGRQSREPLPINVAVGVSYRIPKIPVRLSFVYHDLQTWDLSYSSSATVADAMADKTLAGRRADMFFRHTTWSLEILPTDYLYIVASYDHRRHRDMAVAAQRSIAGFAFGAGFSVKQFDVGLSIVPYRSGRVGFNVNLAVNLAGFGIK